MPDTAATPLDILGVAVWKGWLDAAAQREMLGAIEQVIQAAPPFTPVPPWGKPMSVRMTSAGRYGWFADSKGYRYIEKHPSGAPWPPIPAEVLAVWRGVTRLDRDPDSCLINLYGDASRMGLHQDRDEADFSWPVVSISLGDDARFRVGGSARGGSTRSIWLQSGDVAVLGGDARLAYHGIDKVRPGSSTLVPGGGRINLTLRVVD